MNRILGILALVVVSSLFSCGNKENEKYVTRVDSLFNAVKAIETKVLSMDTADFYKRKMYNEEKLLLIQDNYTDTVDKNQAIFISDIVAVKRSFSKLLRKREEVIDEILFSKGQILDLKKDVSNNLVLENSFNEYFTSETQAVNNLANTAQGLISWGESTVTRHEKMKPKIEEFISNIK